MTFCFGFWFWVFKKNFLQNLGKDFILTNMHTTALMHDPHAFRINQKFRGLKKALGHL